MLSLAMHQWNLVCFMGSLVGSATTVVSMDIRLQSVKVAVKHYAPTNTCYTNRRHQDKIDSKKKSRKASFNTLKCYQLFVKCFG